MTRDPVLALYSDDAGRGTKAITADYIGDRLLQDTGFAGERRLRTSRFYGGSECLDGHGSLLVIHTSELPAITINYKPFVGACATNIL